MELGGGETHETTPHQFCNIISSVSLARNFSPATPSWAYVFPGLSYLGLSFLGEPMMEKEVELEERGSGGLMGMFASMCCFWVLSRLGFGRGRGDRWGGFWVFNFKMTAEGRWKAPHDSLSISWFLFLWLHQHTMFSLSPSLVTM